MSFSNFPSRLWICSCCSLSAWEVLGGKYVSGICLWGFFVFRFCCLSLPSIQKGIWGKVNISIFSHNERADVNWRLAWGTVDLNQFQVHWARLLYYEIELWGLRVRESLQTLRRSLSMSSKVSNLMILIMKRQLVWCWLILIIGSISSFTKLMNSDAVRCLSDNDWNFRVLRLRAALQTSMV